jgi:hypothetical protein
MARRLQLQGYALWAQAGFWGLVAGFATAVAIGFIAGAAVYTGANQVLSRRGAKARKRSGGRQPSGDEQSRSGIWIAAGALLDGHSGVDRQQRKYDREGVRELDRRNSGVPAQRA